MWTLEQVRAEYRRLDRLLGIDTSGIPVRFSKRMTRQYGVCTFLKNRPQEIRLADFLRQEDAVFWDTARHESGKGGAVCACHIAVRAVRTRYSMACTGYCPAAVSPVSIRLDAPSSTAL